MRVAIVGGGAGGLIAGLSLLRSRKGKDLAITIYEREPDAYTTLCGEGIRLETLERFRAFESKPYVAETFRGASWHFPGGVRIDVDDPCGTIERCDWIPAMAEEFRRQGGQYRTGEKISPERAEQLAKENDLVIGADGPGSQVRKVVGGHHDVMLGIQYRVERAGFATDRLQFHTDKRYSSEYAWVFPKGDILNVGLLADGPDSWPRLDAYMAEQGVHGKIVKKEAYPIGFNGTKVQKGNIVLIGDAGGLTNPVTKGGLAAIIYSTEILVDCVERDAISEYEQRIFAHPIMDRSFREGLVYLRKWSNEDFERMTRFAPKVMNAGDASASAKRAYWWPLLKTAAANPSKWNGMRVLSKAMGVSRRYSW
ncbi:MAG: NAD(P)/FAD-dependent oxidoreductase [Thermoplasmatota archaeon]